MAKVHASDSLEHFFRLARRGCHGGASSGEVAARRLAKAIVDDVSMLDDRAISGLVEFVEISKSHPTSARDLLLGK